MKGHYKQQYISLTAHNIPGCVSSQHELYAPALASLFVLEG